MIDREPLIQRHFRDLWYKMDMDTSKDILPEKRLLSAILIQALRDLYATDQKEVARGGPREARAFLYSDDCKLYCDLLDVDYCWFLTKALALDTAELTYVWL